MKAYLFPGQGSQFPGMGKDLYDSSPESKNHFEKANEILGFRITDTMFGGTEEELKQTKITQPAIFIHSVIKAFSLGNSFSPDMTAGHSLGEFSALVAAKALSFEDGLRLVFARALAMQHACEKNPSTMAAVLGLEDKIVEDICQSIYSTSNIHHPTSNTQHPTSNTQHPTSSNQHPSSNTQHPTSFIVVPANYNCPGQLVISGSIEGVKMACEKLLVAGAKRALMLNVGGAFHSPLMEPAKIELEKAIRETRFANPVCPVYQNVSGLPFTDSEIIRKNLIAQLTAPVRWTQTIQNMISDGAKSFTEVGPGKVLQGLVKKVNREMEALSA